MRLMLRLTLFRCGRKTIHAGLSRAARIPHSRTVPISFAESSIFNGLHRPQGRFVTPKLSVRRRGGGSGRLGLW
jgi:hypothetical protein